MATKNAVWLPLRFRINHLRQKRYCNFGLAAIMHHAGRFFARLADGRTPAIRPAGSV
jgi:hypothetical protein